MNQTDSPITDPARHRARRWQCGNGGIDIEQFGVEDGLEQLSELPLVLRKLSTRRPSFYAGQCI